MGDLSQGQNSIVGNEVLVLSGSAWGIVGMTVPRLGNLADGRRWGLGDGIRCAWAVGFVIVHTCGNFAFLCSGGAGMYDATTIAAANYFHPPTHPPTHPIICSL